MIALLIMAVELLIMVLIGLVLNIREVFWGLMDPIMLILIATPGIYLLVAHSLGKQQALVQQQFNELSIAAATFESMDGVVVTDASNTILKVNRSFTEVTGYTNEEAVGKTPAILHSGLHDQEFYSSLWNVLGRDKFWSGEIWNRRKNGEIYLERLTITAVLGSKGDVTNYVGIFSDITRHKQIEQESTSLLHRNQLLMDTSLDGIHLMDIEGNLLEANDAFCRMLGYTQEEITRLNIADWDARWTADELRLVFKDFIGKSAVFETLHRRKDGSLINVEISVTGSRIGDRDYIFASGRDITARKANEQQLHELTAHIQTAREEEKVRIARELHDDLGNKLAALKMETYWLVGQLSGNQQMALLTKHVESMMQQIDDSVHILRRVITDLRPTVLDDLGLEAALEWQCEQFHKRTGIVCHSIGAVTQYDERKLCKIVAINLFRIAQEALTNALKHSGATRVEVEFVHGDEEIMLAISDNGCGVPEGHTISPSSYGIRGMRERVAQLGGKIEFDSPPDGGFRVSVILPAVTGQNGEAA